jgi:hypothetical protein
MIFSTGPAVSKWFVCQGITISGKSIEKFNTYLLQASTEGGVGATGHSGQETLSERMLQSQLLYL